MKTKNEEVMKALSPEEMSMLSNVYSILGEMIGQNSQSAPTTNPETNSETVAVAKENMKTTDELTEKVDDVEKELVTTSSDSATGSDDAKTKIDYTQTEETEAAVNEVAKALLEVFKNKKKQDVKPVNPIVSTLKQVAEVQKSTQEQLEELTKAFGQLITGMGIAQQMEVSKSQKEVRKEKNAPIYAEDMEKAFKAILDSVQKSEPEKETGRQSNNDIIRKNLSNPNFLKAAIANKF